MLVRMDQPARHVTTEKLRAIIEDGAYAPGDRLPPERQLIDLLDVGRSALRRALEQLEREGGIWRHVGKGTFVAHGNPVAQGVLSDIAHQMTPVRMMRARLCIETAIAREAAVNASGEAVAKLQNAIQRSRAAQTWAEYERQDDEFHRAVAEAADNLLLLGLYDDINRVQREVAWGTVRRTSTRPPSDHSSFAEHDAIAAAVAAHGLDDHALGQVEFEPLVPDALVERAGAPMDARRIDPVLVRQKPAHPQGVVALPPRER